MVEPSATTRYLDARPTLEVADLDATLAFWNDVAGFETEVVMGEPAFFAIVACGEVKLGIVATAEPAIPQGAACYLTLDGGLDAFVDRARAAGLEVDDPETRPWNLRDTVVRCPGGGPVIAFGEPVG